MANRSNQKQFFENLYQNPFQKGHAKPKHHWHQVNGETMETQSTIILHHQTRKQS